MSIEGDRSASPCMGGTSITPSRSERHATYLLFCATRDISSSAFLCRDPFLLPIEVCLCLEFCKHFLILERRTIATIHLQKVGGGVDVGFGIFVALGHDPPIRVNAFEYDAYRWQRSSSCHCSGGMAKSHTTCVPSSMSYVLYHTSLNRL
jgi:hypothetical protein